MARNSGYQSSIESIENEIQSLLDSLASLKKDASRESRHSLKSLKQTTSHALHRSGDTLEDVYEDARRLASEAGKAACSTARTYPWATAGLVAGVAVLAGLALFYSRD